MTKGDADDPLRELQRRIEGAQHARDGTAEGRAPDAGGNPMGSALALAWRIGLELVVAVVVGTGLGWAFDHWLGTRPWGMIVMFFLGVAAGMVNVWRAVTGMGMAVGYRAQGGAVAAQDKDDDED